MEKKKRNLLKDKKIFKALLITSLVYFVLAVIGIVFSFVYISNLGLYQSLIISSVMVVLLVLAIFTTLYYNRTRD